MIRRWLLMPALATVAVALSACGGSGSPGVSSPATTKSGAIGGVLASVSVAVDPGDGKSPRTATLSCDGSKGKGTGYLAEKVAADSACSLVIGPGRKRLVSGPVGGACTQQYGGPEQATITGSIQGDRINTKVARSDGCGIADWELLTPLVGAPG